jgi:hypothetical protein
MLTEDHRDYIRQARHFIYISGTGGKDGSINRDILDDLLRLPTRNAHNTEKYKNVINELKKSPEITRLLSHVPQTIYNPPILICIYPFVPQPNKK